MQSFSLTINLLFHMGNLNHYWFMRPDQSWKARVEYFNRDGISNMLMQPYCATETCWMLNLFKWILCWSSTCSCSTSTLFIHSELTARTAFLKDSGLWAFVPARFALTRSLSIFMKYLWAIQCNYNKVHERVILFQLNSSLKHGYRSL